MSSVPRHSEEELRQQWAFLDALVDRQASSLRAGSQDPEEDDLAPVVAAPETSYLEEISTLTRRVSTLEGERFTLLRRLDLAEEARMAAEEAREAAEAGRDAADGAREAAEQALAAAHAEAQDVLMAQGLLGVHEEASEREHVVALEAPTEEAPTEEAPTATIEPAAEALPVVAPTTVAPSEPMPASAQAGADEPKDTAPQETVAAAVGPVKPRRKTWWQRLRG